MGLRTIVHSYKRRESYKQEVEHEEVIEDDWTEVGGSKSKASQAKIWDPIQKIS
jgi:hypothetical protein